MGILKSIAEKFHNWRVRLTWQQAFSYIITGTLLCLFALFFDWLLINWMLGCCNGGVCWPDIYPQCRNEQYQEFYREGL
jgi:glycopeptide antibiotics resistance protein